MKGRFQIMHKYKIIIIAILILCFMLPGCQQTTPVNIQEPDIVQIRSICDLATLECYYHNVAKSTKAADSWFQKDRKQWIEYTGIAKIGIDMNEVKMEISENNVRVTLPNAKILVIDVYEIDEKSFITSEDGLIKNKITADDQTAAIKDAQNKMEEQVRNNTSLFDNAQIKAKKLIENYIRQLGEISNIQYNITWVLDDTTTIITTDTTEIE